MGRWFWKAQEGSSELLIPQMKIADFGTSFKSRMPIGIAMAGFNETYNRNFVNCNTFTEVNLH